MAVRISSKKNGQERHIYVNDQQVYNYEDDVKKGLRSDTLDGFHIDEIIAGIETGVYRIELTTETGYVFSPTNKTIIVHAKLYRGTEDITSSVPEVNYIWTRVSKNPGDDLVWNASHVTGTSVTVQYEEVARGNVVLTCTVSQ